MSREPTHEAQVLRPMLEQFGVTGSATLVVHSAISQLSRQGFRAEAMCEALLEHVAGGNLFMPTMTWSTVTPEKPHWDETTTPSHTGVLTEVFRTRYATARSIHPTHSVAGWGPAAPLLLSRHHVDATPVSANSPYGLMRDYDAYVLMIGVGLECCTAIHHPEEVINADLYVRAPDQTELYQCRDRNGIVHPVRLRRHPRLDRDFPQFSQPLATQDLLQTGDIRGCPYTIVALRDLLRHVSTALIENPRATLQQAVPAAAHI
jgi:aminoglycoside 3-N-acetyltransferase